jgi:hypothetical protein
MSRSFLIVLYIWLFIPVLSAQSDFKKELNIGVSQGMTISRVVFDPIVDQQVVIGYTGGLILRYISEPNLGLQIEAHYLQRGWLDEPKVSGNYQRNQEIIMIPFLTHLYFGKKTKLRLQFSAGPYMAYLLSDSEKNNVADTNEYEDYYGKSIANKIEFGFSGGLSVAFRTKLGIFELQGSYNHSLTNLFKPGDEEFVFLGSRPQTIAISLHYLIKI